MKVKYLLASIILFIGIAGWTGCQYRLPEMTSPLPDDPIVYQTGSLYTDSGTAYVTVEHGGKTYIIYGTIKPKGASKDTYYALGECLGYIDGDQTDLIYSLVGESTDEWLIELYQGYYIADLKESPTVLREISAKGNERIPDCIQSLDYDYWR